MTYQQAVQLPKRPMGRGVIADTSAGKTTQVGGTKQDHGRPTARGWGPGSHSVSRPRGVPETASTQHSVRRVVCPPDRCSVGASHHQCQREPSLNREVGKGPPSGTPLGWQQTITVEG